MLFHLQTHTLTTSHGICEYKIFTLAPKCRPQENPICMAMRTFTKSKKKHGYIYAQRP